MKTKCRILHNVAGALVLSFTLTVMGANTSKVAGAGKYSGLKITSSSFDDNDLIPQKHAAKGGPRKCDGQNISPALQWSNAPSGTKSYAILFTDTAGNHGLGIVHWVAYGIPASTTSLAEGVASSKDSKAYVGGTNRIKKGFYFGPCPGDGEVPHHYVFTIIALDLDPGALAPGLTKEGLFKAIKGHNLAAANFVGRYARN